MFEQVFSYCQDAPYIVYITLTLIISIFSYVLCNSFISGSASLFLAAGLKGNDYGRPDAPPIPEAVGVVCCAVYLSSLSVTLITPYLVADLCPTIITDEYFSLSALLAGGWSICSMCFLGFTDDVLNLKWRNKLILPFISSFPLVLVYVIQGGSTSVLLPVPFKFFFGPTFDLGVFYYIYILMLAVFCTNAINILAGVNGLEAGQSIVIAFSMMVLSFIEMYMGNRKAFVIIFFIPPFLAVSLSLIKYNWFPASVFVGDTYCYFTGMTFAVCGILGHCSKTLLLFFIPQILNFLYSCPQLFKLFPCPRHRLPYFNPETGKREPSFFTVRVSSLHLVGCPLLGLMARFGLAKITRKSADTTHSAEVDNMTLLNLYLRVYGCTTEEVLAKKLIEFQIMCAVVALFLRYTIAVILF